MTWDRHRAEHEGGAFDEHAPLVEELLERIRRDGPLSSTDIEPRAAIDWYWRPTNQVRAILEALAEAGILGLGRRDGNRRVYDLAERLFPADLLARREPERDQRRHKLLSRYRAHGLLGRSGSAEIWYGDRPGDQAGRRTAPARCARKVLLAELLEAGAAHPGRDRRVRGERFVVTAELPILAAAERRSPRRTATGVGTGTPARSRLMSGGSAAAVPASPSSPRSTRIVWDRDFLRTLHGFDYVWEVYVPEPKRRWGYYVLPILYGDRLVGRIELRIDRKAGVLRVLGLWWETGVRPAGVSPGSRTRSQRRWRLTGGSAAWRASLFPRTHTHRPFVAAVRERDSADPRRYDHDRHPTAEAAWEGDLTSGRGTVSAIVERHVPRPARQLGRADRGARGQDEPRGAPGRRSRGLLRDGPLGCAGPGRDAAGAAGGQRGR